MTDFTQYLENYISLTSSENWQQQLLLSKQKTLDLLSPLSDQQALFQYQDGKWSIKEVLQHLIDAERIFLYRALRFSRKDTQPLQGWDEELYAQNAAANARPLSEMLEEFKCVRKSTFLFFQALPKESLHFSGVANGHEIQVEQLGKLLLGHHLHHHEILKTRYFQKAPWNK
ncbi:DinB family protein [Chryseobacterium sp. A301]